MLAYFLAKAERVAPLATAHGWTGHSWRERRFYYPADKRALARYPKVIAVSGDVRHELLAFGASPSRVEVILNGIDPNVFHRDPSRRAAERARYHLLEGDIAIGAVGRLEPQKRFDLLISAVASLHSTRSMLRLPASCRRRQPAARTAATDRRCRFGQQLPAHRALRRHPGVPPRP